MARQQGISPEGEERESNGSRPYVSLGGRRLPMPRSRLARILSGGALVVLGIFGFLPILGFWMIPLGLVVLSYDVPAIRRVRRRIEVWWHRRRGKNGRGGGE